MEKLEYSRYYARIIMNQFITVPKFMVYRYTNGSHEVSIEFCVLKFSSFGWDYDGQRNKERQEPKLGDAQGTPR